MKIVNKKIEELIPYENNPRCNEESIDLVANSIKEFGFKVPIVIDKNNVIVAGHTRYKASEKLGLEEVPCIVADDLTDEQVKAYRLADNKVSEKSLWNYDLLNAELEDILDINMEDFGFINTDSDFDIDLDELDDPREKEKVNVSIVYDCYEDYEVAKERLEKLADESHGNLSIKMI